MHQNLVSQMKSPLRNASSRPEPDIEKGNTPEVSGSSTAIEPPQRNPNTENRLKNRKRVRSAISFTAAHRNPTLEVKPASDLLDQFKGTDPVMFLLYGGPRPRTRVVCAIPISIQESDDNYTAMLRMCSCYYAGRGFWRKFFSFRSFYKVLPVQFRVVRPHQGRFLVTMDEIDLHQLKEKSRDEYKEPSFPEDEVCWFNGEKVEHSAECDEYSGAVDVYLCEVEKSYRTKAALDDIETASFLTICFEDPEAAKYHDVLEGFGDVKFVYNTWYDRFNSPYKGYTGKLRRHQFYGLYIQESWKAERICIIGALLTVGVVLGGKLIWDSWEVVFGAGSFFVAVPMLILAVLSYMD